MRSLLASLLNKRLVPSHQALSSKERLGDSAHRTPSGDILGFGATEHPPTHTHTTHVPVKVANVPGEVICTAARSGLRASLSVLPARICLSF